MGSVNDALLPCLPWLLRKKQGKIYFHLQSSKYHQKEDQTKTLKEVWGWQLRMHLDYARTTHQHCYDECFASCYVAYYSVLMNFPQTNSGPAQLKTELDAVAKTDVRYSCISVSHLQWTPSITKSAGNISWQQKGLQLLGNKTQSTVLEGSANSTGLLFQELLT